MNLMETAARARKSPQVSLLSWEMVEEPSNLLVWIQRQPSNGPTPMGSQAQRGGSWAETVPESLLQLLADVLRLKMFATWQIKAWLVT